ncbi:protein tramtrack, beta isoform isoform X2 [Tribolium castaneum]|uniref:protein tramtrack, beta isoform isoform X2 n=1 Tax=Tribolium castaneum TaxID=7070 RepID=UPI0000D56C26|nr:PREDICTED: protein tramtrack, beta isoform-like isoform X2 [Tribolium castaneum]|eukprot:XP_971758.1 PREDICTED: protein tramtrack, beta isoform-like isoform X2 [Tribolium castaneum]
MATTEQFSLRWNNFHSNLTAGFHELLESSEMVDVTLAVEGHFFQAHKVVLSICSPYFKQMFKVNPCKHPIVILKDVAHDNMKDILEFMYMGEVNVLRENLATFLRTAELLQVKGLTGDDSSETSSRKDDKSESIADNEDDPDLSQFNHLIDSDVELPPYTTPRVPTPPPLNVKRQAKSSIQNSSSKRAKSESLPNKPIKVETEVNTPQNDENDFSESNPTLKPEKSVTELDEAKDNLKQILENNFTSAANTDANLSDQDEKYSPEQKVYVYCPYCYRKFVNRYNLKVHIRDKHEDSPSDLDCRVCGKVMRNRSCLRVHMYHHRKQQLEATCAVPIS